MLRFISFLVFMMGVAAAILGWAILTNNVDKIQIGGDSAKITEVTRQVWTASAEAEPETDGVIALEETSDDQPTETADAPPPPAPAAPVTKPGKNRSLQVEEPMFGTTGTTDAQPMFEEIITGTSVDDTRAVAPVPVMSVPEKSAEELFLESLRTIPIAHETPNSAGYKQAFDVVLAIDATGDDTAVDALPDRGGTVVEGTVQVSDQVEARLAGASFGIIANSPPVQKMSPVTENTWRWSVTPLKAGEHDLVFEIFAVDGDVSTPLRTYRDTVTVEVTGIGHAVAFADQTNPLFVLLGGLGSAIAGLFGVFSFFRKKRA
jgi:LPXTG-motif cell wall-anchored protein